MRKAQYDLKSRWAINQSLINKLMKLTSQNAPSRSATSQFVYFKSTKNEIKFHFDADKSYCIETPAAQKNEFEDNNNQTKSNNDNNKKQLFNLFSLRSIYERVHFTRI